MKSRWVYIIVIFIVSASTLSICLGITSCKAKGKEIGKEEVEEMFYPIKNVKDGDTYSTIKNRGFIIYNDKKYYESGTTISIEESNNIINKVIGTTKDLEENNLYSMKGYDSSFRILSYVRKEGIEKPIIYERVFNENINLGEDIFEKLNIKDNIVNIKYDTFNNVIYNTYDKKCITNEIDKKQLVKELYDSIPYTLEEEKFREKFFYNTSHLDINKLQQRKFIFLELNDGTEVEIMVFEEGYVFYKGADNYVFKIDESSFNKLWEKVK